MQSLGPSTNQDTIRTTSGCIGTLTMEVVLFATPIATPMQATTLTAFAWKMALIQAW